MSVRLRGHHLLCMLTYAGRGYSPAFCVNMDGVIARLQGGEPAVLVEGPDDICTPLLVEEEEPHCRLARVLERDRAALRDLSALAGTPVEIGATLSLDRMRVEAWRSAFAAGTTRSACAGCEWAAFCTSLAEAGFSGARLSGPAARRSERKASPVS